MSDILNNDNMKEVPISDLLEAGFDDVEKVHDLETWPKGIFLVTCKKCGVDSSGNGKDRKEFIQFDASLDEIVEPIEDREALEVMERIEASKQDMSFRFYKGFGLQDFVTRFEKVGQDLGAESIGALVESLPGTQLVVEVGHRDSNGKTYAKLKSAALAE